MNSLHRRQAESRNRDHPPALTALKPALAATKAPERIPRTTHETGKAREDEH